MMGLTPRMVVCLGHINNYRAEHGIAPSVRELGALMNLSSTTSIHQILGALENRGHIRRLPRRARAIEVISQVAAE